MGGYELLTAHRHLAGLVFDVLPCGYPLFILFCARREAVGEYSAYHYGDLLVKGCVVVYLFRRPDADFCGATGPMHS